MHDDEREHLKQRALARLGVVAPRGPTAGGQGHGHQRGMVSIREAEHRGRHIVIRTSYEILVDGEPLEGHVEVGQDGSVHHHGLPNYATPSMVDLVKKILDASDVELPPDEIGQHGEA